jgi:hypothetical protein
MTRGLLCTVLAAGLGLLPAASAPAREGHALAWETVRDALVAWLKVSGTAPELEVPAAVAPCEGRECLMLTLRSVSRENLLRSLPQLLGGFGCGADVLRAELTTRPDNYRAATLVLFVDLGAGQLTVEELSARANVIMRLLRYLNGLGPPLRRALEPARVAADERIYFIRDLTWHSDGSAVSTLLSPRAAARPEEQPDECVRIAQVPGGLVKEGPFAGWRRITLWWNYVCNPPPVPLQ